MKDPLWRMGAQCLHADPDLFFPEEGITSEGAKKVCRSCPVRVDCLTDALVHRERGIWGGLTEDERRRIGRWWWKDRRHALYLAAQLVQAPRKPREKREVAS